MRRVLAIALLASACTSSVEPSLPTAAAPGEPGGIWAVSFQRQMDPWPEGLHGYRLRVTCPDGTDIHPSARSFNVAPTETLVDDAVYLRFDGPGTGFMAPANLRNINPGQDTVAVITLTSMTESEAASARESCEATIVYDGSDPVLLEPSEPFVP